MKEKFGVLKQEIASDESKSYLQPESALRIIRALRGGENCLEGVHTFSVGRDLLLKAAEEELWELELTKGSEVRWLKGRYGSGKTHMFARLMDLGYQRNWVTSYVQVSLPGDGVALSRFNEIYAAIVQNCLCRELVEEEQGQVEPGRRPGWEWILERWYLSLRRQAGAATGDTPTFRVIDTINNTMTALQARLGLSGGFAEALRQYGLARVENDQEWVEVIQAWFRGEDVHARGGQVRKRLRESGILQSLSRGNAKEMLRCLSIFVRYRGFKGLLILFDEVENVLQGTRRTRREAYTVMRELIDNVDDRHGMTTTCFFAAGTPDLFEGQSGFAEYEALAERVLLPQSSTGRNPRAALVDLSDFPLTPDDLVQVVKRIIGVFEIAFDEKMPERTVTEVLEKLREALEMNPDLNVRSCVRLAVDHLDQQRLHG